MAFSICSVLCPWCLWEAFLPVSSVPLSLSIKYIFDIQKKEDEARRDQSSEYVSFDNGLLFTGLLEDFSQEREKASWPVTAITCSMQIVCEFTPS